MAKKHHKTLKIVGITLGVIVLVTALILILGLTQQQSYGFQTLSLSPNVQFNSNDPIIGGQDWLLTVSQNGAGQSASGTFTANSGSSASNQFTISTSLDKDYATYPIYNQNVPINVITYTTATYNPFSSTLGCPSDNTNRIALGSLPLISKVYCFAPVTRGYYGIIGQANVNFQSTITVSGSGGTSSCSLTNANQNSCISSDGNVQASWAGSLVSGQSTPDPTTQGIVAIYNTANNGWVTASTTQYNLYFTNVNNLASCLSTAAHDQLQDASIQACMNGVNQPAQSLLSGYPFSVVGGSAATTTGGQNSGQVILNLPTQVQFQVLTMRVKSALIGINVPSGQPKITSTSSLIFQTGQTGNIAVTVQNVGSGVESMNVGATCTNGFSQNGNSLTVSGLQPQASQTVYIPITANVISGNLTGTCTVTATDINNPNNFDTASVAVSSNAITICTNGQITVYGNDIQQCQSNVWVTTQTCPTGTTAQMTNNGQAQCVNNAKPNGSDCGFLGLGCLFTGIGGLFSNIFSGLATLTTVLQWVIVGIVFIIALSIGVGLFDKIFKGNKGLAWLFAFILAGLLALLAYFSFWIALIALIVFIVIRIIKSQIKH